MIAIIRIRGMVNVPERIEQTLYRLRLRKKNVCVVLNDNKETREMLKLIRNYVAYGIIDKDTVIEMIKKRGKPIDKTKKIDAEIIAESFVSSKKGLKEMNVKPYFRLHPARKGIKSKLYFPRGVLGDHKEKINDLIRRML